MLEQQEKQEKKVEYIELIYDLIFVYLIGRNNSLMDKIDGGFVTFETFFTYLLTSLIILQIWYQTSLFINRYGENGLSEKLMLLINMFLLYIMGTSTVNDWGVNYAAYIGAWTLVFLNLAVQYALKLRKAENPDTVTHIRQNVALLAAQAAVAWATVPIYFATGYAFGPWAMVLGYAAAPFLKKVPVNFAHLTERVMLYVVFSFGEMVISVAGYFTGGFNWETLYFGLMSFLIVAGLFFSYGHYYDRLLNREEAKHPHAYMFLHILLILCLTNITNALDFMREPEVASLPKNCFMIFSMLGYFVCLAMTEHWSYRRIVNRTGFVLALGAEFAVFVVLMLLTIHAQHLGIAVTAALIYSQLFTLLRADSATEERT